MQATINCVQCRMISSRLRRRGPRRPVTAIVPVIQEKLNWANRREQELGTESEKAIEAEWQARWRSRRRSGWRSRAAVEELSPKRLKLHDQLRKAESSALVQARTGRIGLASFLCKARVPGFESPSCRYEQGEETAEYLLLYCPLKRERRE